MTLERELAHGSNPSCHSGCMVGVDTATDCKFGSNLNAWYDVPEYIGIGHPATAIFIA